MKVLVPVLLGIAGGAAAATLPQAVPVSTSYASINPAGSAQWVVDYLGGELLPQNYSALEACADQVEVAWVRLPDSGYEFHFFKQLTKPAGDDLTIAEYVAYAEDLFGNLSDTTPSTYNKYEDYHVGMSVGNLTNIFNRLREGGVDFFMVGADGGEDAFYDLFVEVPFTGYLMEFSSLKCTLPAGYDLQGWDICNTQALHPDLQIDPSTGRFSVDSLRSNFGSCTCEGCTDDSVCWRKTTIASTAPEVGNAFVIEQLGSRWTRQGHPGVNLERCAVIAWDQFDCGYQMHFVNGLSYPEGTMPLDTFIGFVEAARDLSGNQYDQWLDNKLTFWVASLDPFVENLDQAGVPYLLRGWSGGSLTALLLDIPRNGAAIELMAPDSPTGAAVQPWDLCASS